MIVGYEIIDSSVELVENQNGHESRLLTLRFIYSKQLIGKFGANGQGLARQAHRLVAAAGDKVESMRTACADSPKQASEAKQSPLAPRKFPRWMLQTANAADETIHSARHRPRTRRSIEDRGDRGEQAKRVEKVL